ncbi:MAG: FHA domain-containing protein [Lachnospiraceae bacterium]|nr:FHA domain-containing protein [Lachnospiraceae bacterium]
MREPVYKRDYNKSSLVFEEANEKEENKGAFFQLQMILENKIEGFLPCEIHPYNGEKHIYYDITGRQTLACIFEKKQMKAEEVKGLLLGIRDALIHMQEYLLDADNLLLIPEFIYLDLSEGSYFFCFYPFEMLELKEQLIRLAEYLLEKIDHEDQEAVYSAYQFYRQIRESNSSFLQIVEQIYEKREPITQQKNEKLLKRECQEDKEPEDEELFAEQDIETDEQSGDRKEWGLFYAAMCFILGGLGYGGYDYCMLAGRQRIFSVYCKTTAFQIAFCMILTGIVLWCFSFCYYRMRKKQQKEILQTEEECDKIYELSLPQEESDWPQEEVSPVKEEKTMLLAEYRYREERRLVSMDHTKQVIELTDFPFTIGKMEGVVDYVLSDRSVSRMHVRFSYQEEEDTVYVQDLNSTNGTYHNGIRLEGNEMLPIYAQDEIRIGKRIFIYQ